MTLDKDRYLTHPVCSLAMSDPNNQHDHPYQSLRPSIVFGMTGSPLMKAQAQTTVLSLTLYYSSELIGQSYILHADAFEWLSRIPENSLHAIVTDPPYGVKEYDLDQLTKRENGNGGIWRIPPSFDGHTRSPLPRFTALDADERRRLAEFFKEWAKLVSRALLPGGHVFIATNAFIAELLYESLVAGGLEF